VSSKIEKTKRVKQGTLMNSIKKANIPPPVIAVVGEVIGNYYYSHSRLNTLFLEIGAPGEPPEGNCVRKCQRWLKRCNSDPRVDAFSVLGKVLEDYMEIKIEGIGYDQSIRRTGQERVNRILAKYSLSYKQGGQIFGGSTGIPSKSLKEMLENRDFITVEAEFQRAIDSVESDPATGITAACSIIEALCKVYCEDEDLEMPAKQNIKNLWKVVSKRLGLNPREIADQDITRILSGFTSVVDGIGALRTHTSSVHGRGRKAYRLEPRHARLTINAAHTLVSFVLETWDARKKKREKRGSEFCD
jgi:hypothetical protein